MTQALRTYFADYAAHHATAGNKACHQVGIPLIVLSTFALLGKVALFQVGGFTVTAGRGGAAGGDRLLPHAGPRRWPLMMAAASGVLIAAGPLHRPLAGAGGVRARMDPPVHRPLRLREALARLLPQPDPPAGGPALDPRQGHRQKLRNERRHRGTEITETIRNGFSVSLAPPMAATAGGRLCRRCRFVAVLPGCGDDAPGAGSHAQRRRRPGRARAGDPVAGTPPLTAVRVAGGPQRARWTCRRRPGDRTRLFVVEQGGRIRVIRDGAVAGHALPRHQRRGSAAAASRGCSGWPSTRATRPTAASSSNYTDRGGDTHIAEFRATPDPDAADPTSERAGAVRRASPSPTTTAAGWPSAATACSTSRWATAARAAIPSATGRTWARCWARSCASTWTAATPYAVPPDNPFRATRRRAARDLGLRPAQPLALLLRPRHRRPVRSATSARTGARRSTWAWPRAAAARTTAGTSSRARVCFNPPVRLHHVGPHAAGGRLRARRRGPARSPAATSTAAAACPATRARTSTATTARPSCAPSACRTAPPTDQRDFTSTLGARRGRAQLLRRRTSTASSTSWTTAARCSGSLPAAEPGRWAAPAARPARPRAYFGAGAAPELDLLGQLLAVHGAGVDHHAHADGQVARLGGGLAPQVLRLVVDVDRDALAVLGLDLHRARLEVHGLDGAHDVVVPAVSESETGDGDGQRQRERKGEKPAVHVVLLPPTVARGQRAGQGVNGSHGRPARRTAGLLRAGTPRPPAPRPAPRRSWGSGATSPPPLAA